MRYLIDGYNLMQAIEPLGANLPRHGLERARQGLLERLRRLHGDKAGDVTVIFDGARQRKPSATKESYHGLDVRFALGQEADDLIEDLIRREARPAQLTIVSGDRRLQEAARRRGCRFRECLDYLEDVERRPTLAPVNAPSAKPETMSEDEMHGWLKEFEDLEHDPKLKEWFDLTRLPDIEEL